MKTVAVICEYNPFHYGHAALFGAIRQALGADTAILCVLSGNFVQRGEAAIFPKETRARMALACGADLVLELPFPYSCSGGERFADAGVRIAASLGCVDALAFGSECGDTKRLCALAEQLEAPAFIARRRAEGPSSPSGYAARTEALYREVYGEDEAALSLLRSPNDLLALSYIRSLLRARSTILPLAFPRVGEAHGSTEPTDGGITSATAARRLLLGTESERDAALAALPPAVSEMISEAISRGKYVADDKKLLEYCLAHLRLADKGQLSAADGLGGGLAARFFRAAREADTPDAFFEALRTKKYTDAYLRRALLYALFGVRKEALNAPPSYIPILGMNEVGKAVLSSVRKTATIPLLTKPADYRRLSKDAMAAAEGSHRADSLYSLLLCTPSRPADLLRQGPHRESNRKLSTVSLGQALDN